jgi:predicted nucleic acid-binding protein
MSIIANLRVVIDTNVIFEGLTKQGGAAGLIIDL